MDAVYLRREVVVLPLLLLLLAQLLQHLLLRRRSQPGQVRTRQAHATASSRNSFRFRRW